MLYRDDEISQEQMDLLRADGVLSVETGVDEEKPEDSEASEPDELADGQIAAAIKTLDADDYDKSSQPRMGALRKALASNPETVALSSSVDVASRDRVFAAMLVADFKVPVKK